VRIGGVANQDFLIEDEVLFFGFIERAFEGLGKPFEVVIGTHLVRSTETERGVMARFRAVKDDQCPAITCLIVSFSFTMLIGFVRCAEKPARLLRSTSCSIP